MTSLAAPCRVIDISESVERNGRDYALVEEDILKHEEAFGGLEAGTVHTTCFNRTILTYK